MEIPFDIDTDKAFALDLKQSLGFVDSDIPKRKYLPELDDAAQDLIKIIGKPTYDALIANYKLNIEGSDDATAPYQNTTLTRLFKVALGRMAYISYASATDLAHTPNGRRMRSSDDEKTPFPWMIDKDDDNLHKRSYKAINSLLVYMDSNFESWQTSEKFNASSQLFVRTLEDFEMFYQLDSRYLLIKLQPGIKACQIDKIIPRIGQEQFDVLLAKNIELAKTPSGTGVTISPEQKQMIHLIKEACSYHALYHGIPRLQLNLFPEGILQAVRGDRTNLKGRMVPQFNEVKAVSELYKSDSEKALLKIEALHKKMFPPEITTTEPTDTETYGFEETDNFVNT